MREFDTGNDKIKIICQSLVEETIKPAQNKAQSLIEEAHQTAEEIIRDAHQHAQKILENAALEVDRNKTNFSISLKQAYQQSMGDIKQKIEKNLFQPALKKLIQEEIKNSKIIAQMIQAIIRAIEKEGIYSDLSVTISSEIQPKDVCQFLTQEVIQKLKDKPIAINPSLEGGVMVKLDQANMTLDLSTEALEELILNYIRKDLRNYIFNP